MKVQTGYLGLALSVLAVLGGVAQGADEAGPYAQPLSASLESWPYPYPVKYLPVKYESQDLRMAYMFAPATTKAPAKGTVVLLHGKNFDGSYFGETSRVLNAEGYDVLMPDQIGFGRSSKPEIPYSFDLLAAYTIELMDHLKIKQAAVIGHSTGGMLAVRMGRSYPGRVSKLVLENPVGLEDYRALVPAVPTEEWYQQELNNTDPSKIRAFLKRYFVTWKPEYEAFVEKRVRVTLSGEYPRLCKASALTYQMIYQQPVVHEFPLIQQPVLLALGAQDRTAIGKDKVAAEFAEKLGNYPELGKAAARAIPKATLKMFQQCGHIPHLEKPDEYHAAVVEFLKK